MNIAVLWGVTPCSLVDTDWRWRGAFCLHHQCYDGGSKLLWNIYSLYTDKAICGLTSVNILHYHANIWTEESKFMSIKFMDLALQMKNSICDFTWVGILFLDGNYVFEWILLFFLRGTFTWGMLLRVIFSKHAESCSWYRRRWSPLLLMKTVTSVINLLNASNASGWKWKLMNPFSCLVTIEVQHLIFVYCFCRSALVSYICLHRCVNHPPICVCHRCY
jgi:hypothetical protein